MASILNLYLSIKENSSTKQQNVVNQSKLCYKNEGLEDGLDYKIQNIELKTLPGFVSVFEGGFQNEDVLFMIHGYGLGNVFYAKAFPELIKKFHVYSMDIYGFGASYRSDITFKDDDHALDVQLRSIHETIEALNLKSYYLAAHSMGGYLTSHFLAKYSPDNVNGVFLLSPAGSTIEPPGCIEKKLENFSSLKKTMIGPVLKLFHYMVYDRKWSPFSLPFFLTSSYIVRKWADVCKNLSGDRKDLL